MLCSVAPRKRWGQHFLHNRSIARRIVQLLDVQPGATVLEIGPGTGVLTEYLVSLPIRLIAVEIDKRCLELLQKRFPTSSFPHVEFIHADILRVNITTLAQQVLQQTGKKLLLIGNLPYNISSALLFRLFHIARLLSKAVFMLQRELAQRLVAQPGSRDYGILRLACWAVAQAQLHFHVAPSAFSPPPAVVSSVVTLSFLPHAWTGELYEGFLKLLHAVFQHRRKQLHNSLRYYIAHYHPSLQDTEELLRQAGIAPDRRAEELSPEEFVALYRLLSPQCLHAHP